MKDNENDGMDCHTVVLYISIHDCALAVVKDISVTELRPA